MGRKTRDVTIPDLGPDDTSRDKGKLFLITEMPADASEKWAMRMFFALSSSGIDIAANVRASGMLGIGSLTISIFKNVPPAEAELLMDEMFACVQRIEVHPSSGARVTRPLVQDDTEEVATRTLLREAVLSLHVGFSVADALWNFLTEIRSALALPNSQNTSTSQGS